MSVRGAEGSCTASARTALCLVVAVIGLTCASGALGRPAGATPAPARDAALARALGDAPEGPGDHQGTALRAREALRIISGGGSSPTQPAHQTKPAISTGRDRLQLLSQPTWVGPRQNEFRLRLAITASDSANEELSVSVYSELTARSQFQAALNGDVAGSGFYDWPAGGPVPLSQLPADPAGGIDVDLPVNNGSGSLPLTTTGVYPVQAFLERGGARLGAPLRTFVVFAANDALRHLNVSLVVPLAAAVPISSSGSVGTLPARSAPTLRAEIADLNDWHVAATVAADVPTVEALAKGDGADRGAVAGLRTAVSSGDEVLPATSLPFDLGALVSAGLTHDIQEELAAGEVALKASLGVSPAPTTWAFAQGVDPATAATLETMGARQLAVPEADLSGLPASDLKLTFAQPTKVSVPNGQMDVIGADSELSARIGQAAAPGQAVLVANQVLAELAMIDLEAPSDDRGVVVMPAEGTTVDPGFLAVLLAGLDGNPLIKGVTLAQIFHQVPLATVASAAPGTTARPLVRQLAGPSSAAPLQGTRQLQDALNGVAADAEVYGTAAPLVGELSQELVACLSSVFSATQRAAAIGAALQSAQVALAKVRLPPVDSITLTSRQGSLPLSLQSAAGVPVHVRLVLSSEELSFVAKRFDQGSCSPEGPGFEWCQLTLTQATTALEVPVVVRTIGAFPLTLEVETPDGSRQITGGTYTVRSTAISDLGLVLMVGAALFLAVWWARNARHGRRAKRLVPRPEDPDDIGGEPTDPETAGAAAPSAAVAMLRRPASGVRPGPGHSIGPVSRPPG